MGDEASPGVDAYLDWLRLPDPHYRHADYRDARPFPHLVLADALTPADAQAAADEFPPPDDPRWHTFTGELERGKQEGQAGIAGPVVAAIHAELAGDAFLWWLREVTGVAGLVADPDRTGGGIHQSAEGARLGMHTDFNLHPSRRHLLRAVNLLLFVSEGPERPSGGGWLHLESKGASHGSAFAPAAGLLVVFEAGDDNYHGHPVPLAPGAPVRKSIPAYFYRPLAEGEQVEGHSTLFAETH